MFIGTLRYNLDPFVVHTDEEIWEALTKCQMRDFCQGLDLKLAFVVAEGGENLSVGQRQLLCVARALLRNTPILLLDEASASLDMTSDEVLQKMLRTAFAASTTITIAHRLDTIADADRSVAALGPRRAQLTLHRVLVMDHGRVMEFDAPFTLLQNEHGLFRDMCEKSNAADKIRAVALEAFEREKALKQE
jgi:ATP-binding cassette subfamily C (CFTR/MRP) protein 1